MYSLTPTNGASSSTAQDSTYDYYAPSTCDSSQQNMHIAALENLSLAALANRKRKICFASDPPEEIAPNLRLMRSPTPYPKELRLMQAKFAANKINTQQHHQMQRYAHENGTNNLDKQSGAKLLNTMNGEQQISTTNDFVNHSTPMMVNGSHVPNIPNINVPNMNASNTSMGIPRQQHSPNQSVEYSSATRPSNGNPYNDIYRNDSRMHTPMPHAHLTNDIVQYDSVSGNGVRMYASGMTEDSVDYGRTTEESSLLSQDIRHAPYNSSMAYDENYMNDEDDLKTTFNCSIPYATVPIENETNHNHLYSEASQVVGRIINNN